MSDVISPCLGASKELIKDVEAAREEADQLRCAVALHEETIKCLQAQKNAYSIWDNIDVPALVSRINDLEKENKELDSQLAQQRAAYEQMSRERDYLLSRLPVRQSMHTGISEAARGVEE